LGAGCVRELDWVRVTTSPSISTQLAWRTPNELWMFGGPTVLRRVGGVWEETDVCPNAPSTTSVTFDGAETWVLCARPAEQMLLRYDASMAATTVSAPVDGAIRLAVTASGVVVVGETRLHVWDGVGWSDSGPTSPSPVGSTNRACAGVSPTELYCGSQYWNGSTWSPVTVDADIMLQAFPMLRDGAVAYGPGRLVRGTFERWAAPTARPVVPLTIVGSSVLWGGYDVQALRLWRGGRGAGPGDYLGSMPGSLTTSIYAANDVFVYGIDEGTFLVITSWAGVGGAGATLYEGH
jgi:hypothetical protein